MGEIGVYNYLTKEKQWLCKYPDFKIYSKENKNFDSDICSDKYNIHVKSQSLNSAEKFGESWQFQKKDKLTYNPEKNDLIFLTIISEKIVEIKKIVLALVVFLMAANVASAGVKTVTDEGARGDTSIDGSSE